MSEAERNAFLDSKGVRWDTNNSDYEGWLTKKSKWVGNWRSRYFILKGSKLFFSKDASKQPHGMIDLVDCIHAKAADSKLKRKHSLEIKLVSEVYYVCSEIACDRDEWISRIGKAIVRHSSVIVRDDDSEDDEEP